MRICERDSPADTKVSKGGQGGVPGVGAEIPLQPVVKTMASQAVLLQPMEVNSVADTHLQPVEDARAGVCLKEAVTLWEACTGAVCS